MNVIELKGVMAALTPLHLGTGRKRGTFFRTLEYVPGRILRDMFSTSLIFISAQTRPLDTFI